ncbi:hypothetical protein HY523_01970, partial [Candidatus Berkelbacteria bacterium]|nr:hypothetical protein [Candidatus Berkelbacteria bacterium]
MTHFLKQFLIRLLLLGQLVLITPWQVALAADDRTATDTSHHDGTESEPGYSAGQSLSGKLSRSEKLAAMMALYADPSKLQLDPLDQDYIDRWLAVSQAIEEMDRVHPGVLRAYLNNNTIPASIIDDYDLETDPLPPFDAPMLDIIATLMADHDTELSPGAYGDDHELMEISRLIKDFDSEAKTAAIEGAPKPEYGDEAKEIISAHAITKAQAFDVSQLDYIRCTKIVTDRTGTITQKDKLDPVPIELKWQVDGQDREPPPLGPNALSQSGTSFDDVLRRMIGRDSLVKDLVAALRSGDFPVSLADVLPRDDWSGTTSGIDPKDIIDLVGEGLLRNFIGPRGAQLELQPDLASTAQDLGTAILQEYVFPKAPKEALSGETIDEVAANVAAHTLGSRVLGSGGYRFAGAKPFTGLASQYVTGKILGLKPIDQLATAKTSDAVGVDQLVGRIAASQRLNLTWEIVARGDADELTDADGVGSRLSDPALVDDRLHLISGTTADFVAGHKTPDQYFELVGQAAFRATIDAYTDESDRRDEAYGLAIVFTPDTLYLPDPKTYPFTIDRLEEIKRFYRDGPVNFVTDENWETLREFYTDLYAPNYNNRDREFTKTPKIELPVTATDAEKTERARTVLAGLMTDRTAFIARLRAGQLTETDWDTLGKRVVAKALANNPFEELALTAYLESNGQTLWKIPVRKPDESAETTREMPVTNPEQLARDKLGFLQGDLDLVLKGQYEVALSQRFARDLLADATGNRTAGNGSFFGVTKTPVWTNQMIQGAIADLEGKLPDNGATATLRTYLGSLTKNDWTINRDTKRQGYYDQQRLIRDIQATIGEQLLAAKPSLDEDVWQELATSLAGFVAGRTLTQYHQLLAPTGFTVNQRLNLTEETVQNFLTGSPNQTLKQLGVRALVWEVWGAKQPETMVKDLLTTISQDSRAGDQNFFDTYQTTFDKIGQRLTRRLDLRGDITITGQQAWNFFRGDRLPLFAAASKAVFQSLTGTQGSLATSSGTELTQLVGLRKLLSSGGYGGKISLADDLATTLAQTVFEQRQGIKLGKTARDLLQKNGPHLLRSLKAPEGLVEQFLSTWDPDRPESALDLLKQPSFWEKIPAEDVFKQRFGSGTGATLAANLVGIFTADKNSQGLVTAVGTTIQQFFPRTIHFDWGAVGRGDRGAIIAGLGTIGTTYFGKKFSALTDLGSILASRDSSPRALLQWSMTSLPQLLSDEKLPEGTALGVGLVGFFLEKKHTQQDVIRLVGEFGKAVKVPVIGDMAAVISNPRQFAAAVVAELVARNLHQAFGKDYATVARHALRGYGIDEKLTLASSLIDQAEALFADVDDPAAQDEIFDDLFFDFEDAALFADQQTLTFVALDGQAGFGAGISEKMLTGDAKEQLGALLESAPEEDIDSGDEEEDLADELEDGLNRLDFDKIAAYLSPALDATLSRMVGVPVPPNFAKNTVDYLRGKITQDHYQGTLQNFGIAQVTGYLDQKLGLPTGTSYTIYQATSQWSDKAAQVAEAGTAVAGQEQLVSQLESRVTDLEAAVAANPENAALADELAQAEDELAASEEALAASEEALELSEQALADLGGSLAGLAVSMAFGDTFNQVDRSLGLPPGTMSFIVSTIVSYVVSALIASTAITGAGLVAAFAAAAPIFLIGLAVFAIFDALFGDDEEEPPPVVLCSPGGYYPFITRDDEAKELNIPIEEVSGLFDPDPHPNEYHPCDLKDQVCQDSHQRPFLKAADNRLGRRDLADRLELSAGFPGEFYGEGMDPLAYQLGKQASA